MNSKHKLVRITTVPMSLKYLLTGQMKYMAAQGMQVTMMSADGPEVADIVEQEGCPHVVLPLTRKITPFTDLKAIWVLYKHLRKINPDIVHTHTPKAGLIGMVAAWMAKVPHRIHTIAGLPLQTTSGAKRLLLEYIERITYLFATHVWPNSQSLYQFIVEHRFTNPSKLEVIGKGSSNGIDITEFDTTTLVSNVLAGIKEKINYDPSNTYLLFVGRVVRDKGIIELVNVFQKLASTYPNLHLIIVGPLEQDLDPLPNETLESIQEDTKIHAVGFSKEVKYYLHLADIFVFPSHREGFPNSPMQAALMECPVVASRITGNVDLIEHEVDGFLFEKGNESELYSAIEYVLTHDVGAVVKNFKQKIIKDFDRNSIHKRLLDRYLHLMSAGGKH